MKYVITAAYGGTGTAITRRLASKGHELLLIGRNGDKLAALCAEVNAQYVVTDLTNLEAVEAAVQAFGPIDGIVNCAGSILLKPFKSISEDQFVEDFNLNFLGAVRSVKASLAGLKKSENNP